MSSIYVSTIARNAYTVSCVICVNLVHLSCLVNKYGRSGAIAAKNSLEWLHGPIYHIGLRFTCRDCMTVVDHRIPYILGNAEISSTHEFIAPSVDNMAMPSCVRNEISTIGQRVDGQRNNLLDKMQHLMDVLAGLLAYDGNVFNASQVIADTNLASAKSLTYSAAVRKDITDAMKSVAE